VPFGVSNRRVMGIVTDLQSPESVEHLTSKTESYAEKWAPKADEMWQERLREKESRKA
jgi:hypothetical protein